ncbi:MAG: CubicO group peptidase (beta-lactamase class C family) [Candidatus Azotimanducaceae bacterium]|jgi:CubicO group peptidase (beta-lactamase class C family)
MCKPNSGYAKFNQQIIEWVEQGLLPGAHHQTWEAGKLINQQVIGYADSDSKSEIHEHSLFRLASSTKLFISVGFLILVKEGRLALTDPVSSVFPEYGNLNFFSPKGTKEHAAKPMTMEDLLRHSCGYGYGASDPYRTALIEAGLLGISNDGTDHWLHSLSLRDWTKALATVPMEAEPGTNVSYGLGHDLAGAVIEAVSGLSLDAFMQQKLFAPLKLNDTHFVVPSDRAEDLTSFYNVHENKLQLIENSAESGFLKRPGCFSGGGGWDMLGNGGLVTSAGDFARLIQLILQDGTLNSGADSGTGGIEILPPALMKTLKAGATYELEKAEMLPGCSYSYGVSCVDNTERYSGVGPTGKMSWGGSTNTFYYYLPDKQRLGVFLTHTFPFAHLNAIYQFSGLSNLD